MNERIRPASGLAQDGLLFIISGPSGSGKGEALSLLVDTYPDMIHTPTFATREARPGEVDGVDYNFVSVERFKALLERGEILEYSQPYLDNFYGSPLILRDGTPGKHFVVELDPYGFISLKRKSRLKVVGIFLLPPSLEELRDRIQKRNKEANLANRMAVMKSQIQMAGIYDYLLVNHDLDRFRADLRAVVDTEFLKLSNRRYLDQFIDKMQAQPGT